MPAPFFSSFWGRASRGLDGRAAVGQAGDEPHHDGQAEALGQVEGLPGHVVRLLMVGRLEAEDLGELDVEAAVLLVLRAVHAGIVGADDQEAAVGPGDGGVHERVGGDVEADVLERDEGPLSGEGGAEGLFVGDLLVHRPDGREGLGLPRPSARGTPGSRTRACRDTSRRPRGRRGRPPGPRLRHRGGSDGAWAFLYRRNFDGALARARMRGRTARRSRG